MVWAAAARVLNPGATEPGMVVHTRSPGTPEAEAVLKSRERWLLLEAASVTSTIPGIVTMMALAGSRARTGRRLTWL